MVHSEIESRSDRSSMYSFLRPGSINPTESNWSNPDSSAYAQTLQSQSSLNFYDFKNSPYSSRAQSISSTQNYPASREGELEGKDGDTRTLQRGGAEASSRRFFFGSSRRSNTRKIDVGRWVQYISRGRPASLTKLAKPLAVQNSPYQESSALIKERGAMDSTSTTIKANENAVSSSQDGGMKNGYIIQEDMIPHRSRGIEAYYDGNESTISKPFEEPGFPPQENMTHNDTRKPGYRGQEHVDNRVGDVGKVRPPDQETMSSDELKRGVSKPGRTTEHMESGLSPEERNGSTASTPIIPSTSRDKRTQNMETASPYPRETGTVQNRGQESPIPEPPHMEPFEIREEIYAGVTIKSGAKVFEEIILRLLEIDPTPEGLSTSLHLQTIGEDFYSISFDFKIGFIRPKDGLSIAAHDKLVVSILKMVREQRYQEAMKLLFEDFEVLKRLWSILIQALRSHRKQIQPESDEATETIKKKTMPKLYMCKMEILLLLAYIELKLKHYVLVYKYLDEALDSCPSMTGRYILTYLKGMIVCSPTDFVGQSFYLSRRPAVSRKLAPVPKRLVHGIPFHFQSGSPSGEVIFKEGVNLLSYLPTETVLAHRRNQIYCTFSGHEGSGYNLHLNLLYILKEFLSSFFLLNSLQGSPMALRFTEACNYHFAYFINQRASRPDVTSAWQRNDSIGCFIECLQRSNELDFPRAGYFDQVMRTPPPELCRTALFPEPLKTPPSAVELSREFPTPKFAIDWRHSRGPDSCQHFGAKHWAGNNIAWCLKCCMYSFIPESPLSQLALNLNRGLVVDGICRGSLIMATRGAVREGLDDANNLLRVLAKSEYKSDYDANEGKRFTNLLIFLGADMESIRIPREMYQYYTVHSSSKVELLPQLEVYKNFLQHGASLAS